MSVFVPDKVYETTVSVGKAVVNVLEESVIMYSCEYETVVCDRTSWYDDCTVVRVSEVDCGSSDDE